MAYDTPFSAADRASLAASGCHRTAYSAPVTIKKVGRRYVGRVNAKVTTARPAAYIVFCRRKGKDLVISIKPKRRGQPLRKTYGSRLGVQIFNPTNRLIPVTATFTATK